MYSVTLHGGGFYRDEQKAECTCFNYSASRHPTHFFFTLHMSQDTMQSRPCHHATVIIQLCFQFAAVGVVVGLFIFVVVTAGMLQRES